MPETTVNKLPFPSDSDAPNGPLQIGQLAETLDVLKWGSRNSKLSVGFRGALENMPLTINYVSLGINAGLEITPAVPSTLLVIARFQFERTSGSAFKGLGTLKVDSETLANSGSVAVVKTSDELGTDTVIAKIALTAAKHTIVMVVKKQNEGIYTGEGEGIGHFIYAMVAS